MFDLRQAADEFLDQPQRVHQHHRLVGTEIDRFVSERLQGSDCAAAMLST
jgi:hypothetical protein